MSVFAKRLTQLRESQDLKKKQLAQILNVSASCVSQYENGSSMPGCDTLMRISQYFGVSVDYLLGNDDGNSTFPLNGEFCDNVDYATLLARCSRLPSAKRHALLTVINALQDE